MGIEICEVIVLLCVVLYGLDDVSAWSDSVFGVSNGSGTSQEAT